MNGITNKFFITASDNFKELTFLVSADNLKAAEDLIDENYNVLKGKSKKIFHRDEILMYLSEKEYKEFQYKQIL